MAPVALVAAYLLGSIPFGYVLFRLRTGQDIRNYGSRNIGATNVARTLGKAAGLITLLLDLGKGYVAVWLVQRLTGGELLWSCLAALAVMVGHAYPVFLRFRGGKSVATFIGAFLRLTPLAIALAGIVFLIIVLRTRYVSLGSICAALTFPLAVWLMYFPPLVLIATSIIAGLFIVYRHKENIERLRQGRENRLQFGLLRR